jgi:mono/diheme cytochrome c family protein
MAAARELERGAVTAAQSWLCWSAWLAPGDGRTDLIRAACFRRMQDVDSYARALESARKKGVPASQLEQEVQLGRILAGGLPVDDSGQIARLLEAGLPPNEVALAFVCGFLNRDEPEEARRVLDAWAADRPDEADVAYARGIYWDYLSEPAQAEADYERALARQPRHEPARMSLAELFERQDRLEPSYQQYAEWLTRAPGSDRAIAGVARILRKLGHIEAARAVLRSVALAGELPAAVAVETAQIELESGALEQSRRWFQDACWNPDEDRRIRNSAATAFALSGDMSLADKLFAQADAAYQRLRMTGDLQVRLAIRPGDGKAADDLNRLLQASTAAPDETRLFPPDTDTVELSKYDSSSASDLYARHCSDCHGVGGNGEGRAARHLFPRPRNLRTGKSRLVSTDNAVATLGDQEAVIRLGMPGSSMPPFEELTESQVRLLAEEVVRLNREGMREQFVAELRSEGDEIDEDEVREVVELSTTPGQPIQVPRIGPLDAEAADRGKDAYFELGCIKCHGNDGRGPPETLQFDETGFPSAPRDLVVDPLKGGRQAEAIYLRILLGMPGTPHPGCLNVPQAQLIDLVQYCRWISREPERELTNHQRLLLASLPATSHPDAGAAVSLSETAPDVSPMP